MAVRYRSGEEIRPGDSVRFAGQPAKILFVATERVGDPSLDWFVDAYPGGGAMISAEGWGRVFVQQGDPDMDDLEFVSRSE